MIAGFCIGLCCVLGLGGGLYLGRRGPGAGRGRKGHEDGPGSSDFWKPMGNPRFDMLNLFILSPLTSVDSPHY